MVSKVSVNSKVPFVPVSLTTYIFEMNIEPDDLKHIQVEGTLLRRHLFHFIKELSD
ncbi:hypothetical protein ACFLWG_04885 [Chloroflexota bacterium]